MWLVLLLTTMADIKIQPNLMFLVWKICWVQGLPLENYVLYSMKVSYYNNNMFYFRFTVQHERNIFSSQWWKCSEFVG